MQAECCPWWLFFNHNGSQARLVGKMRFWGHDTVYIAVGNEVEYDPQSEEGGHLYLPDPTRDGLDPVDPRRYDSHGQGISPYILPPREAMDAGPPVDFAFENYEPDPCFFAEFVIFLRIRESI